MTARFEPRREQRPQLDLITLRVSPDLHMTIKEAAEGAGCTMQSFLIQAIQFALSSLAKKPEEDQP